MTDHAEVAAAAITLRELHVPGKPLVLPNIWDAGTAKLVAAAGFPAVATSSGAVAESLGHQDNQNAPVAEMFAAAARIRDAVDVPVTVDAEAGYDLTAPELVRGLIAVGAAGCNLEDTDPATHALRPADEQARWLADVRAAADAEGVPLVINARIDVFIRQPRTPVDESAVVDAAVGRARLYAQAGADCVYPILMRDADAIASLITALAPIPVNVNPLQNQPIARLGELGAARVSLGTSLWRQAQQALAQRLADLAAN